VADGDRDPTRKRRYYRSNAPRLRRFVHGYNKIISRIAVFIIVDARNITQVTHDGVKLYIFRFSQTRVGMRKHDIIMLARGAAADGRGLARR